MARRSVLQRREKVQRAGRWRYLLPLLVLWAVPVLVLAVLLPTARSVHSSAVSAAAPSSVRVGEAVDRAAQSVTVSVRVRSAPQIRSATSGLVTGITARTGQEVKAGGRLLTVDGTGVFAYQASAPLYRDLQAGSVGNDVVQLGRYLLTLQLLDSGAVGSRFDYQYAAAVRQFEQDRGLTVDGVFHKASAAWVPSAVSTLGTVEVKQGDEVAAGQTVARGVGTPSSLTLALASNASASPVLPDGDVRLTVGAASVTLPSARPTGTDLTRTYAFLRKAVAAGTATVSSTDGIEKYSGPVVSTAKAQRVGTVPTTAIYRGRTTTCLFLKNGGSYRADPLKLTALLVGDIGAIGVPDRFAGRSVATYPEALPAAVRSTCK